MTEKEKLRYLLESRKEELQKKIKLYYRVGYFFFALLPISFILGLFKLHPIMDYLVDNYGVNGAYVFFILIMGLGYFFVIQAYKKEREIKDLPQ